MNRKSGLIVVGILSLAGIFLSQMATFTPAQNKVEPSPSSVSKDDKSINSEILDDSVYDTPPHVYKVRSRTGVTAPLIDVDDPYWSKLLEENRVKYGDFIKMYWPDYLVNSVSKFDVDGDGVPEQIAHMLPPGVNGKGSRVDIVKDGKIIFTYSGYYSRIEQAETNNGFYLFWTSGEQFDNMAGETKVKYLFEDNKFIPISEETVGK